MKCMCIFCGHFQNETVKEKTTMVCKKCHRPTECYEDGRTEISPLYYVKGDVEVVNTAGNVCKGFGAETTLTSEKDFVKRIEKTLKNLK